jgi:hypothetical protein
LNCEAAANASEVALVEQVGTAVLTESENESLIAYREGKRRRPTEVKVPLIERAPIRRGKVVVLIAGAVQIGSKSEYSFTVAPVGGAKRVACGDQEHMTDGADSSRRPDAAAPCACGPSDHLARFLQ